MKRVLRTRIIEFVLFLTVILNVLPACAANHEVLTKEEVELTTNDTHDIGLIAFDGVPVALFMDGALLDSYTGLFNDKEYGWVLIQNGYVDTTYSGLYCDPVVGWWLLENGTINFNYSDLYNDVNYGWWKVKNGTIDREYTGWCHSRKFGSWYVTGGTVDFDKTNTEIPTLTEEELSARTAQFLSESMFIGDSIMLGYRNYCMSSTKSGEKDIVFHCVGSYSCRSALAPVSATSCHPMFQGKKVTPYDQLAACPQVKRVFIMLGMNDIAVSGLEGARQNYQKVINKLLEVRPDLEIYIMSMTYILPGQDRGSLSSANAAKFNEKLQDLAEEMGYGYLDMATPLSDGNGCLSSQYCSDGFVHISRSGYNVWSDVLAAYVAEQVLFME